MYKENQKLSFIVNLNPLGTLPTTRHTFEFENFLKYSHQPMLWVLKKYPYILWVLKRGGRVNTECLNNFGSPGSIILVVYVLCGRGRLFAKCP